MNSSEFKVVPGLLNYNCGIRGGWQSAAGRRKIILDMACYPPAGSRARVLARARARGATGGNLLFAVVDKLVLHLTLL
jgi:hypothetical protein